VANQTIVQRVVSILRTSDDATTLDNVVSVAALVFVAGLVTPILTMVLPIVPTAITLPLTAGLLHAVVERLTA